MTTTVRVLTPDRRLIEIATVDPAKSRELLPAWYVAAKDGVLVPRCDLADYESGRRVPREFVRR